MSYAHYDGVIVEDIWGKTYLISNCPFARMDLGEDYLTLIQDLIFGRQFLYKLQPEWQQDAVFRKLYLQAMPWCQKLPSLNTQQVVHAVIDCFISGKLLVWQLTDGWSKPPAGSPGIGGLVPLAGSGAVNIQKAVSSTGSRSNAKPVTNSPDDAKTQAHDPQSAVSQRDLLAKPLDLCNAEVRNALFAQYDITVGPYKDLQKISKPGYQREHIVPHSNFMERSVLPNEARGSVPIAKAFGQYTEADAITYFVYDDQSQGTEHRYLTDVEKSYAKALHEKGEYASVNDWLDYMEIETAKSLSMETIERSPDVYCARIPPEDAADVARALRIETEHYFDKAGVNKTAPMSNLVGGGDVPIDKNIDTEDNF